MDKGNDWGDEKLKLIFSAGCKSCAIARLR